MAKKPVEEEVKTVPALVSTAAQDVASLADDDDLYKYAGQGMSNDQADRLVPLLGIVQENSGEVKKKGAKYIEGVEAGMMIMRSLGRTFTADKDENALLFQPCAFQHMWVEWEGEPGNGRPVNQFPFNDRPKDAREVADPQDPKRKSWVRENGNRLVDTRYHYGFVLLPEGPIPLVIPFAGTNHKTSRKLTELTHAARVPGREGPVKPPSWFGIYALTTVYNQRDAQTWYTYDVKHRGYLAGAHNADQRKAGAMMFESVNAGELKANIAEAAEGDVVSGGDTEAPI